MPAQVIRSTSAIEALTARETEVLELISRGLTNGAIATRLGVSVHTVKFHLGSVYRKLGVSNRTEAAAAFFQGQDQAHEDVPAPPEPVPVAERRAAPPPALDLPADRLATGDPPRLHTAVMRLDGGLTDRVAAFARSSGRRTEGEVFLGAFAALLVRYTGQLDFGVGTADSSFALRRLDLSGEPDFREVVERLPVAPTYAEKDGETQVVFGYGTEAVTALDGMRFALGLCVVPADEGALLELRYDANLFEATTAERMLGNLETLLAGAVAAAETPLWQLPLLTERERRQLLVEWNRTDAPSPQCCLHELVTEQALRTPERVAVAGEGGELVSYEQLEARSNQLANHLHSLGVQRNTLVGLCVERTPRMLVALLGILKAGGAYVPLDPSYPADRQRLMLEDAGVRVLVTQEELLASLPPVDAAVVCLDRDLAQIERLPAEPPLVSHSPDQLACVIYTSGSTGRPKGVELEQRGLVNLLTFVQRELGFSADDVFLALTTLSFDIAATEIFVPLLTGGCVALAPDAAAGDPRSVAELLERHSVTFAQATPTGWQMLVDGGWAGRPELNAVTAGEPLSRGLADELLSRCRSLWNLYGPTETTIYSTGTRVESGGPITIGRPVANTQLFVLDPRMEPVPVGVSGELHIGGHGLARGYLGQPEMTQERFLASPFATGTRIYKTGDLVRYRPDGALEHLGRIDHQVKVRGFRIELGEVEAALMRHDTVSGAVVVKAEPRPGDARLLAYVVQGEKNCTEQELRGFVAESLPSYMVPSRVVTIESFPLTPNGKIDRKALPAPSRARDPEHDGYRPASNRVEQRLVEIWEDVLDIRPIGVTDDFFDLGATSIIAADLFTRIEKEFGARLPITPVFGAPTIEALALLIDGKDDGRHWTSLIPIQPKGTLSPIFCVHGGAGTVLHLQPLARRLAPDRPFYGLQAQGLYGDAPPITSIEGMAEHYLSELRALQPHGPYYIAGYCFGGIVAFDMAHRLRDAGEEVALLTMFNAPSPPYIRTRYLEELRGREEQQVPRAGSTPAWPLARAHHIARSRWRAARSTLRRKRVLAHARFGIPLPEGMRDLGYLIIAGLAEWSYEPRPYAGEMLLFSGEGLYDDPELGWTPFADRIDSFVVPGDHSNNRVTMAEPYAGVIAEQMREYL